MTDFQLTWWFCNFVILHTKNVISKNTIWFSFTRWFSFWLLYLSKTSYNILTLFKSFKKHLPPTYAALILQLCFPINSITYDNFWLFSPTYKGLNFWLQFLNSSIPIALNPDNHVVSVYPHFYRLIFKDSLDFSIFWNIGA